MQPVVIRVSAVRGRGIAIASRRRRRGWRKRPIGMLVKFVLTMEDLLVGDRHIDELEFGWTGDLSQDEILTLSRKWITTQNFLTDRMIGLERVGESSLTIEPIEPQADAEGQ